MPSFMREVGEIDATDLAQHALCAIKDGRADLLTPQVIRELEQGVDTVLQSVSDLSWEFSSCRFLGAKTALAGTMGVVACAGGLLVPDTAATVVMGGLMGLGFSPTAGEAMVNHAANTTAEEAAEESAFAQRYGFAFKYLLKTSLHTSGSMCLSWGFRDLREDDTLFEFVLKSKHTTLQRKVELLHVLIGECKSEHIGAERLEHALENAAKAMNREQSHSCFAAPAQVLAEVKGFQRKTVVPLSWVQLEHARSAGEHALTISSARKTETLPFVDLMAAAGEMSLKRVDVDLPADPSFRGDPNAQVSMYYLSAELTVAHVASKLNSLCVAGQFTDAKSLLNLLDNVVKEMPLRFKLAIPGGSDVEMECASVQEAIEALQDLAMTEATLPRALMKPPIEPLPPGLDEAAKAMVASGMPVEQVAQLLKVDLAAVKVTLAPDEQTDGTNCPIVQVSALTEGPHDALPLYFTFGGYSKDFAEPLVCATISTEKPLPEMNHLVDDKVSTTPSILQRMNSVCGATNFSLILRNSEHMMRYIVTGTWRSLQTMEHSNFYKKVVAKEFVEGIIGKARQSSAQRRLRENYNVPPEELDVAREASLRPVYCEKTCAACAAEEDGENSDGDMTVEKDPLEHVRTPPLFVQMDGKEPLSSLTPEMMEKDINIVVTGPTGSGKSHLINVLFNCVVSDSSSSMESVTQDIHFFKGKLNMSHPLVSELAAGKHTEVSLFRGKVVNIIDTIGFCDTHLTQEQVMATIKTKLKHNLINVHKVIVVTDATHKLTLQATQAIQDIMSWLKYKKFKRNWIFVSNKCDGLSKAEREKNLADTMKLLRVNQTDVESSYGGSLIKRAIPVGFRPKDRHMNADAKKSERSLGMAVLGWNSDHQPIPVQPQQNWCKIS